MAALLLSAGWAQGETCMQLTPSGWKEREDRKEDYLLTGLKEKIGILPLLNGGDMEAGGHRSSGRERGMRRQISSA